MSAMQDRNAMKSLLREIPGMRRLALFVVGKTNFSNMKTLELEILMERALEGVRAPVTNLFDLYHLHRCGLESR